MISSKLATAEAPKAKRARRYPITLQKWITAGMLKAPKPTLVGAVGYSTMVRHGHCCFADEVKQAIYRKGRKKRSGNH